MIGQRAARMRLRIRPGVLAAEVVGGAKVLWAGECAWSGVDDLPRAIAEIAAASEPECALSTLTIAVDRPLMQLRRVLGIPPVRPRVLQSLVRTQSTRYFRRNGLPLVTDARWVDEDGTRMAQLCAMEASLLEALAEGASAAGLRLVSVVPFEGEGLSLLPPSTAAAQLDRVRRSFIRWSALAAAVWALVGAASLMRLTITRRKVDQELARLEAPAAALRTLRREMRTAREMTEAIASAERSGHDLTRRFAEVAAALPDSAFLTSLSLTAAGNGTTTGYAPRAAEVAANFERANSLRAPHLEGRIVREAVLGREWDRFSLSFGDSVLAGRHRGN